MFITILVAYDKDQQFIDKLVNTCKDNDLDVYLRFVQNTETLVDALDACNTHSVILVGWVDTIKNTVTVRFGPGTSWIDDEKKHCKYPFATTLPYETFTLNVRDFGSVI